MRFIFVLCSRTRPYVCCHAWHELQAEGNWLTISTFSYRFSSDAMLCFYNVNIPSPRVVQYNFLSSVTYCPTRVPFSYVSSQRSSADNFLVVRAPAKCRVDSRSAASSIFFRSSSWCGRYNVSTIAHRAMLHGVRLHSFLNPFCCMGLFSPHRGAPMAAMLQPSTVQLHTAASERSLY
jgi:hypothetical protein